MKQSTSTISATSSATQTDWELSRPKNIHIPVTGEMTTADRLLYLKECLDNHLIDERLFRALRDKLTYGGGLA